MTPNQFRPSKPHQPNATSLALSNMRALVIVTVVAFHAMLAYLGSLAPHSFNFDVSPYKWRAFPIVDTHRWYGFDLFCAWQDVYLMSLMFFLSALFTWPSLTRKGTARFLTDRFVKLGVPFLFALAVIMPIALYPVYRATAIDPGIPAYLTHLAALPFWPNGPMWFLWQLLAFTALAAALHRFVPKTITTLVRLSATAARRPTLYFAGLVTASALAYTPLAILFTPWDWSNHGPLAIQLSRPLHYAVYYLAGLGVGALGLENGLLAQTGPLAQRWASWLTLALTALALWMGLTALTLNGTPSLPLQIAVGISFALACGAGVFSVIATCLRFGARPSPLLDRVANRSFGIYLFHYIYVVWLQYALLGLALFAIAKAAIVLAGSLILAWVTVSATSFVPFGWLLAGTERPRTPPLLPSAAE